MEAIPQEVRSQIPRLGETAGQQDPMVWVKLVNPLSGWQWYLIELEQHDIDTICYVYEVGWDEQLTYFNLADLELHAAQIDAPNQLDTSFAPCRLSQVREREETVLAKFLLGNVVITQGALEALAQAEQSALEFIKRHAQGDWGELDTDDIAENEFSLVNDLRLLSAYNLADGTRIWIITEADRSVTTLLLPEEY